MPKSWQDDENGAVSAVGQISFPFFDPRWLPWGTALFYQVYVLKEVVALGGILSVSPRELMILGRLAVYASAIGAVTAVFLLGRKLFDAWTGKVAALLLAVSPGFVITAHYFKVEVPMVFWLLVTLLAIFEMRRTARMRHVVISGLLVGYTASTQYSGAILVAAAALALFQARLHRAADAAKWFVVAVAGGFLFGTPYALLNPPNFYAGLRLDATINHAGSAYTPARPPAWIDYPVHVLPYSLTLPILLIGAAGLVVAVVRERTRLLPIWGLLLTYFLVLGLDNSRIVRATVPVIPLLALFAAYVLGLCRRSRAWRIAANAVVAAVTAFAFVFALAYVNAMAKTDPRVQAAVWIEREIPRGTAIAQSTTYFLDVPQLAAIGYRPIEVSDKVEALATAPSRYLILSDMELLPNEQALAYHPEMKAFLSYVRSHYCERAYFENSQKLLGINAKVRHAKLPFDWLYPDPRVTILERGRKGGFCHRFTG
jgi:hypothetical protein